MAANTIVRSRIRADVKEKGAVALEGMCLAISDVMRKAVKTRSVKNRSNAF
jgi:antitoxin component of RelBE/YafQ-DinJ toxin-antitoxin module